MYFTGLLSIVLPKTGISVQNSYYPLSLASCQFPRHYIYSSRTDSEPPITIALKRSQYNVSMKRETLLILGARSDFLLGHTLSQYRAGKFIDLDKYFRIN